MGILRLYLATCVIATHSSSVLPWGFHSAREAVQIFFVISGFYMQLILGSGKYQGVRDFYLSRALRIFVPYFVALLLVVAVSVATGLLLDNWMTLSATVHPQGNGTAGTAIALLTNLSLFFQDWVMFIKHESGESLMFTTDFSKSEHPLWRYLWIPPAWSIGVELTFYVFAPYLVKRLSNQRLFFLIVFSLAMRLFCYSQLRLAHDPWILRFFPFEIVHFLYGVAGCRLLQRFPRAFDRVTDAIQPVADKLGRLWIPMMAFALLACLWLHMRATVAFCSAAGRVVPGGGELAYLASLCGWALIVPVLFAMSRRMKVDRFIGELSYPVYLLHYTIIGLCVIGLGDTASAQPHIGEIATGASIIAAVLLQLWIFQPFDAWRQHAFGKPT